MVIDDLEIENEMLRQSSAGDLLASWPSILSQLKEARDQLVEHKIRTDADVHIVYDKIDLLKSAQLELQRAKQEMQLAEEEKDADRLRKAKAEL